MTRPKHCPAHVVLCLLLAIFVLLLTTQSVLAIESVVQTMQCDAVYNGQCKMAFTLSKPRGIPTSASSFVDRISLPASLYRLGITVSSANSKHPTACTLIPPALSAAVVDLELRSNFFYTMEQRWDATLLSTFADMQHIVECVFTFPPSTDIFIPPSTVTSNLVVVDAVKLREEKVYQVISAQYGTTPFPALIFQPSLLAAAEFTPTTPTCADPTKEDCVGDLKWLPRALFPLMLVTTHTLELSQMSAILNTANCPMTITTLATPTGGFSNRNYFNLQLNPSLLSDATKVVTCEGLVMKKSVLAFFEVIKLHQPPSLHPTDTVVYSNRAYNFFQSTTPSFLMDCFDPSDSRCTTMFLFPLPPTHPSAANLTDVIVGIEYLDPTAYLATPSRAVTIPTMQMDTKLSWLSPLGVLQHFSKLTPCSDNAFFLESKIATTANTYPLCLTLRKSLQSHDPSLKSERVGVAYQQVMRLSFMNEYLPRVTQTIHFDVDHPIPSENIVPNFDLTPTTATNGATKYNAPIPTFTTPLETYWDYEGCKNPKSPLCTVSLRSRYVGGPLTITLSSTALWTNRHVVQSVKCNTANMGLDSTGLVIQFPAPDVKSDAIDGLLGYSATAEEQQLQSTYLVDLVDPYDHTKRIAYHECVISFSIPLSNGNDYHVYNPQSNAVLNITTPGMAEAMDDPVTVYRTQLRLKNTFDGTQLPIPQLTVATSSTLHPFDGVDMEKYIAEGLFTRNMPMMWDMVENEFGTTNMENYLIIQTYFERTLVASRPNTLVTVEEISAYAHLPLYSSLIVTNTYPNATGFYEYAISLQPLVVHFDDFLLTLTPEPDCQNVDVEHCSIKLTYPSFNTIRATSHATNTLRSFTVYWDGVDFDRTAAGDFSLDLTSVESGAIKSAITATTTQFTANQLKTLYGINPIEPEMMPLTYAEQYYITPPAFNPNKLHFTAFNINIEPLHQDKLYENEDKEIVMVLKFKKTTQFYFNDHYNAAKPFLLSYGAIHDTASAGVQSQYAVISQPAAWSATSLASIFQPQQSVEFEETCNDEYSSQCRLLIHRNNGTTGLFVFTIDLWSFTTSPMFFYHPDVDGGKTKIYYVPLVAGDLLAINIPVRPLDPTSRSATVRVLHLDIPPYVGAMPSPAVLTAAPLLGMHGFHGTFTFDHPPAPVTGTDCTDLSDPMCSFTYTLHRPVYKPIIPTQFLIAVHNITSTDYLYVNETLRFPNPTWDLEDLDLFKYSFPASLAVYADGVDRTADLGTQLVATITGSSHPNHKNDQLVLTLQLNPKQRTDEIWFHAATTTSAIQIVVKLIKTATILSRQFRTKPQIYMSTNLLGDPSLPSDSGISSIRPFIIPSGLGYRPFHFTHGPDCTTTVPRREDFTCTLIAHIYGTPQHPIQDLSRILDDLIPPHPMLSAATLFFYAQDIPDTVYSTSDPELRKKWSHLECLNLTQVHIAVTPTEDISDIYPLPVIDQYVQAFYISEPYQRTKVTCYAKLTAIPGMEEFWDFLLSLGSVESGGVGYYPWIDSALDLGANGSFEVSYHLNKGVWYPPDWDHYWLEGAQYYINDEILDFLRLPVGKTKADFVQQFVDELRENTKFAYYYVNGVAQLPSYYPRFHLQNCLLGPAFNFHQYGKHFVSSAFLSDIPALVDGTTAVPDTPRTYLGSHASAREIQYTLYTYTFTTHLGDMVINNDLGYDEMFYPCLSEPEDGNGQSQLSVAKYLLLVEQLNRLNNAHFNTTQVPHDADPAHLRYNYTTVPPSITQEDMASLEVLTTFRYNPHTATTRMFINPTYMNTQVKAPPTYGLSDVNDMVMRHVTQQWDDDEEKPTLRERRCYFYAPLHNHAPRYAHRVPHKVTIILHKSACLLGEHEVFNADHYQNYPVYFQSADTIHTATGTTTTTRSSTAAPTSSALSNMLIIGMTLVVAIAVAYF